MYTYQENVAAMIVGVGLMGQHMAQNISRYLQLSKLILVDATPTIRVGTKMEALSDFAQSIAKLQTGGCQVVAETVNITGEAAMNELFRHH